MNTKEKIVYKSDASRIEGQVSQVILPKTAHEVQSIVKFSKNIVPRGAGTGLVGGAVPLNSIVLDMSKMDKILVLPDKKLAEVEPGVILEDLNQELAKYGLEFPVNPSSAKSCTLGGMIATDAVGTRAVKYGKTSDWIKEVEIVNGKGEIVKISKLDIADVSGMEGITGIIVKAKLNLTNLKKRTATLIKVNDINKLAEIIRKLKAKTDVSAIELLDKLTSKYAGLPEVYHLLVEYESDAGQFKDEEYHKIMDLRDSIYPKLASEGFSHIEDPQVMSFKIPELAKFLEERNIPFFGHAGVGILHPCFKEGQEGFIESMLNFVKKVNGQISGEHGIGLAKKKFVEENDKKLYRRIKKRFDPENKINPGKMLDIDEKTEEKKEEKQEEKNDESKFT